MWNKMKINKGKVLDEQWNATVKGKWMEVTETIKVETQFSGAWKAQNEEFMYYIENMTC